MDVFKQRGYLMFEKEIPDINLDVGTLEKKIGNRKRIGYYIYFIGVILCIGSIFNYMFIGYAVFSLMLFILGIFALLIFFMAMLGNYLTSMLVYFKRRE
jgi:cytochrome c biogenesis protein ResB